MREFIAQACINLRPLAGVSVDEHGIHWHNIQDNDIPSDIEINEEAEKLAKEFSTKEYYRQRAAEYPPIGDQLDALFHAGVFPAEMAAQIQAIKDRYPKL